MGIRDGLCNDFDDQLGGALGSLNQMRDLMNSPLALLDSELSKLVGQAASSPNDVKSGMNTIGTAAVGSIPPIPDVSDIENILQECDLLKGSLLGGLKSPAEFLSKYLNQVLDLLDAAISGALELLSDLLEAPVAFIIDQINNLLALLGLGDLLSMLDGLFNCIEALCDTNIGYKMDSVDDTLNNLKLDNQGNFDPSMAFAKFNIDQGVLDNVTTLADKLKTERDSAKESLEVVADNMESGIDTIVNGVADVASAKNISVDEVVDKIANVSDIVETANIKESTMKSFFT